MRNGLRELRDWRGESLARGFAALAHGAARAGGIHIRMRRCANSAREFSHYASGGKIAGSFALDVLLDENAG